MQFETVFSETINAECVGCVVSDNTKFVQGRIYQSKLCDLSQDFEIAYPGMVVISPLRHVSNYIDLTEDEHFELNKLIIKAKEAILKIYNCTKVAYMFYEKPNGHVHFVIIPMHGLVEIKDKYSILRELMDKIPELKADKNNMKLVVEGIEKFREFFNE